MAAAREGAVEFHADGSVTLGGRDAGAGRGRDPGDAAAGHGGRRTTTGLVVVIDTELTPELRAEGDARELQRAIQDLRKEAGLDLDDRIELWVDGARRPRSSRTSRPSPPRRSPTSVRPRGGPPAEAGDARPARRRRRDRA